jgi:hypothetical protein
MINIMKNKLRSVKYHIGHPVSLAIAQLTFWLSCIFLLSLGSTLLYGLIHLYPQNGLAIFGLAQSPIVIHTVPNMPWTDVAENILGGFLIAHGQVEYTDFVTSHFPGVPALLGFVFKLFNASTAAGGIETLKTTYILAIFSSSLFQLSLVLIGLLFFTKLSKTTILVVLTTYCLYCLTQHQFAVPMSETMMVPIVLIAILHFLNLWSGQLKIDFWQLLLALEISGLAILIGLTAAPFFIFYCASLVLLFALNRLTFIAPAHHGSLPPSTLLKDKFSAIFFVGLLVIVCGYVLIDIDLSLLYFWNIPFNVTSLGLKPIQSLLRVFSNLDLSSSFTTKFVLFSQPSLLTLLILTILCTKLYLDLSRSVKMKWFILLFLLLMYCSFFWRVYSGYKAYPSLGFVAGVMIWIISKQCHAEKIYCPKLWFSTGLFVVTSAILMIYFSSIVHWSQAGKDDFRHTQFNLCPLKLTTDSQCSCLAPTIYGPQFFLEKDVLNCKGVFPTLTPGFFDYSPRIRDFSERYKTESIAILYYESIPAPYIPQFFKDLIKQSDCQPFDAISQVCKYPK